MGIDQYFPSVWDEDGIIGLVVLLVMFGCGCMCGAYGLYRICPCCPRQRTPQPAAVDESPFLTAE